MNEMALSALNGNYPLNIVVRGRMENKLGIAEILFISEDKEACKNFYEKHLNDEEYLMIYNVPYDTDLTTIGHYPSVAFEKSDFE